MNAKALFKTVFSTTVLVLILLMGMHNRTTIDFNLLPVLNQSYHGPVALMYFAFFGIGVLMGLVISIRAGRKQTPPPSGGTTTTPRMGSTPEPRIGSRIS